MSRTFDHTITTGIPISLSSLRHSSLCSRVTLTVRREKRSTSSVVPAEYFSGGLGVESENGSTNRFLWPLLLLLSPLHASQGVLPATQLAPLWGGMREAMMDTHHSSLEFWRLAIEYICGLDSVLGNSNGAIEKPHQMAALGTRAHQRRRGTIRWRRGERDPHLVVSPASFVSISPSLWRTAMRNW
jgi:hypothetical protein